MGGSGADLERRKHLKIKKRAMQPTRPETAMTIMRVLLSSTAAILLSREGGVEPGGPEWRKKPKPAARPWRGGLLKELLEKSDGVRSGLDKYKGKLDGYSWEDASAKPPCQRLRYRRVSPSRVPDRTLVGSQKPKFEVPKRWKQTLNRKVLAKHGDPIPCNSG